MMILQRIYQQFFELYRSMSPSQRLTLVVAPLLVVGGFALLLGSRANSTDTALSWGKVFSTEELISAEQALIQAGLTDFRREGQRIMVPVAQADRYNAALLEFDAIPNDLGTQMLAKFESLGPFSTDRQRQELKEAMLLQELRRVLRAVPDLEDARVVVAGAKSRQTWGRPQQVTANVAVRPRGGHELSRKLVTSIRLAVASMVPDLKPSEVTVFDVVNGVTHAGDPAEDPFDSELMRRVREFTRDYEQKISRDLGYIPEVGVTVHVDVDNLKSSVVRSQTIDPQKIAALYTTENTVNDTQVQTSPRTEPGQVANRPGSVAPAGSPERRRELNDSASTAINGVSFEVAEKELIAAMPRAVQVSVTVPRDYYRSVAASRTAAGEKDAARLDPVAIETEVLANIRKSVAQLIPFGSPPGAVSVTSVDLLPRAVDDLQPSIVDSAYGLVREWGGPAALAVLALFALVMLRRQGGATDSTSASIKESDLSLERLRASASASPEEPLTKPMNRRDQIQSMVRDNPEAAASVIAKWLSTAK
jgi:flagellar M-ring protein FliF